MTVIVLCNRITITERLAKRVAEVYLPAGDKSPPLELTATPASKVSDSANVAPFAGRYVSEEVDAAFVVEKRGSDALVLIRPRNREQLLSRIKEDQFAAGGLGTLGFERDADGKVTGFRFSGGGVVNLRFARQ